MTRNVTVAVVLLVIVAAAIVIATKWASGSSSPAASASESPSSSALPSSQTQPSPVSVPAPDPSVEPVETSVPATSGPDGPSSTIPGASAVVTLASLDPQSGTVVVGGFVTGVLEDGGTCVFTVLANDTGEAREVRTEGAMNVDSTTCGSRELEKPHSPTDDYSVTLEYTSSLGAARSAAVVVEVPK
jgi:hypothetical protein